MIPDAVVEEVRARADIVDVIGEHVPLKRAGREYKALCPFHTEKTPSFYVVPAKGFYTCFGCGASGDVFDFLMQRLGLEFPEAVRLVAARVGVDVPESEGPDVEAERHRALYEAVAFAEDFYRRMLESPAGEKARHYLEKRGLGADVAERFGLGYAPAGWRALIEAATPHEIGDAVLLEAGLVKESERAEECYDRLRDRLVFPIRDVGGRTIGFGGRVLGPSGPGAPKYLNSPETPIYHKGHTLYGLNWAKHAIRKQEAALVVEGYMDYVSLAVHGFEHAIAPLGTSLTDEQARLLAHYTHKAYLLYDSDAAGLRATFRSADALLRSDVHPLVVTLPPGEDPDSLVRTSGGEPLAHALDEAVDVLEKKLQILDAHHYFDDIQGTRRALDRLLPTLRAASDPALRDLYIDRIARRTGVRRETLEEELERDAAAPPTGRGGRGRPGPMSAVPAWRGPETQGAAAQRKLLLLLLRDRALIPEASARLEAADFFDPVYRAIFERLVALPADRGAGDESAAVARSDESAARDDADAEDAPAESSTEDEEAGSGSAPTGVDPAELGLERDAATRLRELLADPEELSNAARMFADLVAAVGSARVRERLSELDQLLVQAESKGEAGEVDRLLREMKALRQELPTTGGLGWGRMQKRTRRGGGRSAR